LLNQLIDLNQQFSKAAFHVWEECRERKKFSSFGSKAKASFSVALDLVQGTGCVEWNQGDKNSIFSSV